MTRDEFYLWLKGFMAAVNGVPTEQQWFTIKQKMNEIVVAAPQTIPYYQPISVPVPTPTHYPQYVPNTTPIWVTSSSTPTSTVSLKGEAMSIYNAGNLDVEANKIDTIPSWYK